MDSYQIKRWTNPLQKIYPDPKPCDDLYEEQNEYADIDNQESGWLDHDITYLLKGLLTRQITSRNIKLLWTRRILIPRT
jgi:hypothetical protein